MPPRTPANMCSHFRLSTWAGNKLHVPLTDLGPGSPGRGRHTPTGPRRPPTNGSSHGRLSTWAGSQLQAPLTEPGPEIPE